MIQAMVASTSQPANPGPYNITQNKHTNDREQMSKRLSVFFLCNFQRQFYWKWNYVSNAVQIFSAEAPPF